VSSTVIFWTEISCWHKSYSNKATLLLSYKHFTVVMTILLPLRNIYIWNDNG